MRENRTSGSEGGEPQFTAAFLPLSAKPTTRSPLGMARRRLI
jgi:hypothetical protein